MLGEGGVEEVIIEGILEAAKGDEEVNVENMLRNIIVEELVDGSSLICRDEGWKGRVYRMHRLVRRFILDVMERGSVVWNEAYSLAFVSVYELVETKLKRMGCSFHELPYQFENHRREFIAHALALAKHYELPTSGSDLLRVSKVVEIHFYCNAIMHFFDNPWNEDVCKGLYAIFEYM